MIKDVSMENFKPMLAQGIDSLSDVYYPCFLQFKIDGIRCLITDKGAVSRNLKPIPNKKLRAMLNTLPVGLDGELLCSSDFQETTHKVMSEDESIDGVEFHVFDLFNTSEIYDIRRQAIQLMRLPEFVYKVKTTLVNNVSEVLELEDEGLSKGYEGIILRSIDSGYKFGRSTLKQGWLLKFKRFVDSECEVIGSVEMFHNNNEKEINALGNTKRSRRSEGMVASDILGALIVKKGDVQFQIGSGFTLKQRAELWKNRETLVGKIVKYKSFEQSGVLNAPRFPTFLGFRDKADLDVQ